MIDWEEVQHQIPDGVLERLDLDSLPAVLITNISNGEYLEHRNDWAEFNQLPMRYCSWRPSESSLGEVVAVEMPSVYHETAVRAIDQAIILAEAREGILETAHRLLPFGSAPAPEAEPNGSWSPAYTEAEIRQLHRQGMTSALPIGSCEQVQVGVSQDFRQIEDKLCTKYLQSKILPKLFLVMSVVPFRNGQRLAPGSIPIQRPDLFCEIRLYVRDGNDHLEILQRVSTGSVDEHGKAFDAADNDHQVLGLPYELLYFGTSRPSQASSGDFLNVETNTIMDYLWRAIDQRIFRERARRGS